MIDVRVRAVSAEIPNAGHRADLQRPAMPLSFSSKPMSSKSAPLTEQAQEQIDVLADQNADSTNSDVRYMAYAPRLMTAVRAASRYIAYVRHFPMAFLKIIRLC